MPGTARTWARSSGSVGWLAAETWSTRSNAPETISTRSTRGSSRAAEAVRSAVPPVVCSSFVRTYPVLVLIVRSPSRLGSRSAALDPSGLPSPIRTSKLNISGIEYSSQPHDPVPEAARSRNGRQARASEMQAERCDGDHEGGRLACADLGPPRPLPHMRARRAAASDSASRRRRRSRRLDLLALSWLRTLPT